MPRASPLSLALIDPSDKQPFGESRRDEDGAHLLCGDTSREANAASESI